MLRLQAVRKMWSCAALVAISFPASVAAQTGPVKLVATVELRIDSEAADLVPISWLGWSKDRLAVAQRQDGAVRLFDRRGRSVGKVGSIGAGPGQFRSLQRVGWYGDTLWTWDAMLRRLTFFDENGRLLRTNVIPAFSQGSSSAPARINGTTVAVRKDGSIIAEVLMRRAGSVSRDEAFSKMFVLSESSGVIKSEIATYPRDNSVLSLNVNGGAGEVRLPFVQSPVAAVSNDGAMIALIDGGSASIAAPKVSVVVIRVSRDTAFRKEIQFVPERIPRRAVDSALNQTLASPMISEALRRSSYDGWRSRIPEFYPPVTGAFFSSDGHLWVGLRSGPLSSQWQLYSQAGDLVGELSLPASTSLIGADKTHAWGTVRDKDDNQSIAHLRYKPLGAR